MGRRTETPKQGMCNARLPDGFYCAEPYCTMHTARKTNLFRQRLRKTFDAESQELWDDPSIRTTNLEDEIGLSRMMEAKYREMISKGEEHLYSDSCGPEGGRMITSVHDLLARQEDIIRKLSESQNNINPGAAIGGNLKVMIEVTGSSKPEGEIPDLTTGEEHQPPSLEEDVPVYKPKARTGYDDE